jgi:sarcosine oxidase subunit beta
MQFCTDEIMLRMARCSYERFMAFSEELGASVDFKRTGWMYVATEASVERLREQVALLQQLEVGSELLDQARIAELYPELNTDDLVLGSWGPDDGSLDPHMVMWGYLNRARALGASLYEETMVTDLQVRRGRVTGVQTPVGTIECDVVIDAAGPWATQVSRMSGIDVPLRNSARTIVVTNPMPQIPPERPFVEDLSTEWYCRPEVDGVLMGMGRRPVSDPDRVPLDDEQVDQIVEIAVHRVPVLQQASLRTAWTGVRPLTADGLPIVGKVPGLEGMLLNCGWGGTGVMMAPIAGQMLCELVTTGSIQTIDATPLRLSRFADAALVAASDDAGNEGGHV